MRRNFRVSRPRVPPHREQSLAGIAAAECRPPARMLHLVLFEPEIPPNTGNVIRLCANSGARLHLIKPLGFRLDDKSLKRSGLDYHDLALLTVLANLEACMSALAAARWVAVETSGTRSYADFRFRETDALLFGPETRGLPAAVRERIGAE